MWLNGLEPYLGEKRNSKKHSRMDGVRIQQHQEQSAWPKTSKGLNKRVHSEGTNWEYWLTGHCPLGKHFLIEMTSKNFSTSGMKKRKLQFISCANEALYEKIYFHLGWSIFTPDEPRQVRARAINGYIEPIGLWEYLCENQSWGQHSRLYTLNPNLI